MLNGATRHEEPEEILMATDATTTRLFVKLDEISSAVATTAADVARTQGTQKGIELAIGSLNAAIGDVTEMKVEAARNGEKLTNVEKELGEMKTAIAQQTVRAETRNWVEPLVRWAVAALAAGGGLGAGAEIMKKVL